MVESVNTVLAEVSNVGKAVEFYRAILGREPDALSDHWAEFRLGAVKIGLHSPYGPATPGGGGWVLALEVASLAEVRRRLATFGIEGSPDHDIPSGVLFEFVDLDGNRLQAIQRKF